MPSTLLKEIRELNQYRKTKFHSLNYIVSIESSDAHRESTEVSISECDLEEWLLKDNKRIKLSKYVSDRIIEDMLKLHLLWFHDYNKVRDVYYKVNTSFVVGLFSRKRLTNQELDKAESYMADLRDVHTTYNEKMKFLEGKIAVYC